VGRLAGLALAPVQPVPHFSYGRQVSLERRMMKTIVGRIAHVMTVLLSGWSYDRWDPPFPGDGI